MTANDKPAVAVSSDQPPSYQLEIEDITVAEGEEASSGHVVEVHYVGVSWKTGQQFDASWDRGNTFKFKLGKGNVIPGWDRGVAGMKVGGCFTKPGRGFHDSARRRPRTNRYWR